MTTLLAAAAVSGLALAPVGASASPAKPSAAAAYRVTEAPLPAGEHRACPLPTRPGEMQCQAVYLTPTGGRTAHAATAAHLGYNPRSLRDAYRLTAASRSKGRGVTIAIVDAFRDPNAGSDLAVYRKYYGLAACTRKNGCLKIVNQNGRTSHLPGASSVWAPEESLDLDTVSAICPHCRILLVEANNSMTRAMGTAERTAARRARFVSNSWSGANFPGESRFNGDFNHRGHVIDFAAGDYGYGTRSPYGTAYPTGLPFVTAVGGTSLRHVASRGRAWTETVWNSEGHATNSGCTRFGRPSWQRHAARKLHHCSGRIENDVAASADPQHGIAVFDTYQETGWMEFGGTSEATPLITAMWALAGRPGPHAYPVSYLYKHPGKFYDVRIGNNGSCKVRWLCHAERGFDAPTGLGSPLGLNGLRR
ncbi:MAG: S53 family peptidase [Streptosporangiaceae bacterium]